MLEEAKELLSETDWRGVLALILCISAGLAVILKVPNSEMLVELAGVAVGFWFGKK